MRENDHSRYKNWIDPNKTIPYEKNAKIHTEKQIDNIIASISRFGWQQDTAITKDNVVVIGHGRRLAAIKMGCMMPYHRVDKTADELTDEEIRELRIADNQTNAETGYDFDKLQEDLNGLDFDQFDFDFDIPEPDDEEYYGDERERTYKGVNLKDFDAERSDGFYQMPIIKPTTFVPDKLIGFNYARTAKETDCGIHFFIDDYQFERMWNDPDTNIGLLHRFECALTPDWSLYMDMPMAMKVWNVYRSRLIGQLMQDAGIEVIPTISWAQPETYQFCFDGLKPGGTIAVSTVGVMRDEEARKVWADGMTEALKRLKPHMVLCYGVEPTFFDFGNVKTKMISAREWGS